MALTITRAPEVGQLVHAYNRNIFEIESSDYLNAVRCTLEISNSGIIAEALQYGARFHFDMSSILPSFMESDLTDTLSPNIGASIGSYSYDGGEVLRVLLFKFVVTYQDGTDEVITRAYEVLQSARQTEELNTETYQDTSQFAVLHKTSKRNQTLVKLKYWSGYPFDISLYRIRTEPMDDFVLQSNNTLQSVNIPRANRVIRFYLCDGETDITNNNVFNLVDGENELRLSYEGAPADDYKTIILEKINQVCGVYIKYRNNYGGWDYHLFEGPSERGETSSSLGELLNYSSTIENQDLTRQVGRESQEEINLLTDYHDNESRAKVFEILRSPTVYFYTGEPFNISSGKWIQVKITTTGAITNRARNRKEQIGISIELPKLTNVKL